MAAGKLLYHQLTAKIGKMTAQVWFQAGEVQLLAFADSLGAVLQIFSERQIRCGFGCHGFQFLVLPIKVLLIKVLVIKALLIKAPPVSRGPNRLYLPMREELRISKVRRSVVRTQSKPIGG